MTFLVILFDRKFQVFKNSPKWTFFDFFEKLLSAQNVNVARFARNIKWDFFCDFQTPWASVNHHHKKCNFLTKKIHILVTPVSFNNASEASYVNILSGQKLIKNAKKILNFGEFLKNWSLGSNIITRVVNFNRTKIGENCQIANNSNETFWMIFNSINWFFCKNSKISSISSIS